MIYAAEILFLGSLLAYYIAKRHLTVVVNFGYSDPFKDGTLVNIPYKGQYHKKRLYKINPTSYWHWK